MRAPAAWPPTPSFGTRPQNPPSGAELTPGPQSRTRLLPKPALRRGIDARRPTLEAISAQECPRASRDLRPGRRSGVTRAAQPHAYTSASEKPSSSISAFPSAAVVASSSQRSLRSWPACPFTHTKLTSCGAMAASSRFHRSTFFTGCF